jgi:hypothetical protein
MLIVGHQQFPPATGEMIESTCTRYKLGCGCPSMILSVRMNLPTTRSFENASLARKLHCCRWHLGLQTHEVLVQMSSMTAYIPAPIAGLSIVIGVYIPSRDEISQIHKGINVVLEVWDAHDSASRPLQSCTMNLHNEHGMGTISLSTCFVFIVSETVMMI